MVRFRHAPSTLSFVSDLSFIVIAPSEKVLPARLNMDLIKQLQTVVAPQIFTPRGVYDGRKNMFAARELPFGESGTKEVSFVHLIDFMTSPLIILISLVRC